MTLYHLFHQSALKYPLNTALGWKAEGVYKTINYRQLDSLILKLSAGFLSLGVRAKDRVAILSENRAEWVIADLALNRIGAVNVPIHTNFSFKYIKYILTNSRADYLLISDWCYEKIKEFQDSQKIKTEFARLKKIIYAGKNFPTGEKFISFRKILALGNALNQAGAFAGNEDHRLEQNKESAIASIVYTSGTIGLPKGVALTNKNFLSNIFGLLEIITVKPTDKFLSFLPLSHVLERTGGYYSALAAGAAIFYAENPKTLPENLLEVKPTILISVPRIYEKFYEKILAQVRGASKLKQKIFYWAMKAKKKEASNIKILDIKILRYLKFKLKSFFAEQLVFKKIKNNLGGQLRLAISGGAGLNLKIAKFFDHLGFKIIEGYGLTETAPVLTCNRPDNYKLGTVGLPLSQVEIKINQDKEILARGPNVALGYLAQTNQTESNNILFPSTEHKLDLTADGWFKTGDLGFIDRDGFLTIIGRKKIMLITSGGKNVNPEALESAICLSPFISQALTVGDRQKFIAALIAPDQVALKDYALKHNIFYINYRDLLKRSEIISLIDREIKTNLQYFADYEQVKKFILLVAEFTQEANELTPTLKLRRPVILQKYKKEVLALYRERGEE